MNIVSAKKGIEHILEKIVPTEIEELKILTENNNIIQALERFETFLTRPGFYYNYNMSYASINEQAVVWGLRKMKEILAPLEIDAFLTTAEILAQEYENLPDRITAQMVGIFTSALIQNSYNAGYHFFPLNTQHFAQPLACLGWRLQRKEDAPLHIFVKGAVGSWLGKKSEGVMYTIAGDIMIGSETRLKGFPGEEAEDNLFILYGKIHIGGTTGTWTTLPFLDRDYSPYLFIKPQDCVFKAIDPATVEMLLNYLPAHNLIYQIEAHGRETLRCDYHGNYC